MSRIDSLPSPRLEVRDLRMVLALASAGTTARAAALLHVTQPAVSRALLAAEARLGVQLFDRTRQGLALTPAGARLVAAAGPCLAELEALERQICEPQLARAELRVVCECYTAYHWVPSALQSLQQTLPGITLSLAIEHTSDPVKALEDGDIDVALLTTATLSSHAALRERRLFSDEIVFVLSRGHRLAAERALTSAQLTAETILTSQAPVDEQRWYMRQVFGRARPSLRVMRLPLTEAILDMARAGMGIAVLSEWMASGHLGRGDLVTKRLASGPLRRPWRLAWRREVGDAARRLHAALEATVPRARLAG